MRDGQEEIQADVAGPQEFLEETWTVPAEGGALPIARSIAEGEAIEVSQVRFHEGAARGVAEGATCEPWPSGEEAPRIPARIPQAPERQPGIDQSRVRNMNIRLVPLLGSVFGLFEPFLTNHATTVPNYLDRVAYNYAGVSRNGFDWTGMKIGTLPALLGNGLSWGVRQFGFQGNIVRTKKFKLSVF